MFWRMDTELLQIEKDEHALQSAKSLERFGQLHRLSKVRPRAALRTNVASVEEVFDRIFAQGQVNPPGMLSASDSPSGETTIVEYGAVSTAAGPNSSINLIRLFRTLNGVVRS